MSQERYVTEEQAKKILEKLDQWLETHPAIDEFTERLDATVETIWPLTRIAALYVALDGAITQLRRALPAAKFQLSAMELAATEPEIAPFVEQLKLDEVSGFVDDLELALTHIPRAFAGTADKRKPGTKPKDWYVSLVRDLVEVAWEIGIPLSTDGNRAADEPHQTALTRLVYEVEKFLPKQVRSPSVSACKQRIVEDLPGAMKLLGEDRDLEPLLNESQLSHIVEQSQL